jgi:hypothetical protein
MTIRLICACEKLLEFRAADIEELVVFHIIGPRFILVVPVQSFEIGVEDLLSVILLCHRLVLLPV